MATKAELQEALRALTEAASPFDGGFILRGYEGESDNMLLHPISFKLGSYRRLYEARKAAKTLLGGEPK